MTNKEAETLAEAVSSFTNMAEEIQKTAEKFHETFEESYNITVKSCIQQAAGKFLEFSTKYVEATFLTRWYWARKMRKTRDAMYEMERMLFEKNEQEK